MKKIIFQTSDLGIIEKKDGQITIKPMDDTNFLKTQLTDVLTKRQHLVFVASNPNGFEITDMHADGFFTALKLSKLPFEKLTVLDNRNKEDAKNIIDSADFVFLAGGHVPTQNNFFKDINLKKLLSNFEGVIMGQSAGAMNLSDDVYNYPESSDEFSDPKWLEGLGLSNFTIIPHFEPKQGNLHLCEGTDLMKEYFLPDSKNKNFICITDGSHILIKDNKANLYGDVYQIKDGVLSKICEIAKEKSL